MALELMLEMVLVVMELALRLLLQWKEVKWEL
jgi:hypothetical protein